MSETLPLSTPSPELTLVPDYVQTTPVDTPRKGLGYRYRAANIWAYQAGATAADLLESFVTETAQQTRAAEGVKDKSIVLGTAATLLAGQAIDRGRIGEIVGIPYAIGVAEEYGPAAGAATFTLSTYLIQMAAGGGWGLGIKQFKETADIFDSTYPGYKDALAENKAGYTKTLVRHSILGLGTGNTAFVAAETLGKNDITTPDVLKITDKTSRRIAVAGGLAAYGVLRLSEAHYERYVGPFSVPDVVDRMKQPSTWIAFGVGFEVIPRAAGAAVGGVKKLWQKLTRKSGKETDNDR